MYSETEFKKAVAIANEKGLKEIEYLVLDYSNEEIWTLERAKKYFKVVLDPEDMKEEDETFNTELEACESLSEVAMLYNQRGEDEHATIKTFEI